MNSVSTLGGRKKEKRKSSMIVTFFFLSLTVVLGKIRSAVGSAQLLMSQKFQQFQGLCEQNLVCTWPFCDDSTLQARSRDWKSQLVSCTRYQFGNLLGFFVCPQQELLALMITKAIAHMTTNLIYSILGLHKTSHWDQPTQKKRSLK